MDKKAESISMSVIIIAAIALLVLVILAVLVLRAGTTTVDGTSCAGTGGTCTDSCADMEGGIFTQNFPLSGRNGGCSEDEICCVPVARIGSEE